MKSKVFIYPISNRLKTGLYNPYLDNFITSTQNYLFYVNRRSPSDIGIFNLIRYINKIDFLALNWVENLPDKKGGVIQALFFLIILRVKKIFGFKVIWTLHNKISHSTKNLFFKRIIFNNLLNRSDLIITHAKEGIIYSEKLHPGVSSRIFYFPHPVEGYSDSESKIIKEYDIIIWGTIAPYKNIDKFLEFLGKKNALESFRILIAGKAISNEYYEKIKKYKSNFITIKNQFVNKKELLQLIAKSRIVLFTYAGDSVLSSGALIDSIAHNSLVLGPNTGAFAEMEKLGIIATYADYDDLMNKLRSDSLKMGRKKLEIINDFIRNHTWQKFSEAFISRLSQV